MPFPDVKTVNYEFNRIPRWGDIYWYDYGIPRARQNTMAEPHLSLVISDTTATLKGTVLIIPISGAEHRKADYLFHVPLTRAECPSLDKDSIVKVDQIYCVPTQGLPDQYYLTHLDKKTMVRIYGPLLRAINTFEVL